MMAVEKMMKQIVVSDGRKKKAIKNDNVKKLWQIWCETTDRTDVNEVHEDVEASYTHWLDEGYGFDDLAYITRAAATFRPKSNDKHDVKRLLDTLDDQDKENQAIQMYERKSEIFLFKPTFQKLKTMRHELADLLDDDEFLWDDIDEECAEWLMTHLKPDDVKTLRSDMEQAGVWSSPMSPEGFFNLRRQRKWRKNLVEKKKNNSSSKKGKTGFNAYEKGAREAARLEDIDFSVDPDADIVAETRSVSLAVKFHQEAPDGYWSDVAELIDKDDFTVLEAYDELEEDYEWHPREREK